MLKNNEYVKVSKEEFPCNGDGMRILRGQGAESYQRGERGFLLQRQPGLQFCAS